MSSQNWRQEINAEDFFGNQKKQAQIEMRRPVVRKPSDLVGPGIAPTATRITDFNNILATYNGYFSALAGADNAPTATDRFLGFVVSDAELGGWQEFRSLDTGISYRRMFARAPYDSGVIHWYGWLANLPDPIEGWTEVGEAGAPDFLNGWANYGFGFTPARFKKISGVVHLDGIVAKPSGSGTIFQLPVGYRPEDDALLSGVLYKKTRNTGLPNTGAVHDHNTFVVDTASRVNIAANGGVSISSDGDILDATYLSLAGITFPAV